MSGTSSATTSVRRWTRRGWKWSEPHGAMGTWVGRQVWSRTNCHRWNSAIQSAAYHLALNSSSAEQLSILASPANIVNIALNPSSATQLIQYSPLSPQVNKLGVLTINSQPSAHCVPRLILSDKSKILDLTPFGQLGHKYFGKSEHAKSWMGFSSN